MINREKSVSSCMIVLVNPSVHGKHSGNYRQPFCVLPVSWWMKDTLLSNGWLKFSFEQRLSLLLLCYPFLKQPDIDFIAAFCTCCMGRFAGRDFADTAAVKQHKSNTSKRFPVFWSPVNQEVSLLCTKLHLCLLLFIPKKERSSILTVGQFTWVNHSTPPFPLCWVYSCFETGVGRVTISSN